MGYYYYVFIFIIIFHFFYFFALDHQIQNKFLNKIDEFSVGGYDKLS